jgi:hypothetical protein
MWCRCSDASADQTNNKQTTNKQTKATLANKQTQSKHKPNAQATLTTVAAAIRAAKALANQWPGSNGTGPSDQHAALARFEQGRSRRETTEKPRYPSGESVA